MLDQIHALIERLRENPDHRGEKGQLTLPQLKELIHVGGEAAGWVVEREHPVDIEMHYTQDYPVPPTICPGFVDLVWRRPDDRNVIVAWESDGIDADRFHIYGHEQPQPAKRNAVGIIRKLSKTGAEIKVNALFSIHLKRGLIQNSNQDQIHRWHNVEQRIVPQQVVRVLTDGQLLDGRFLQIIDEASLHRL